MVSADWYSQSVLGHFRALHTYRAHLKYPCLLGHRRNLQKVDHTAVTGWEARTKSDSHLAQILEKAGLMGHIRISSITQTVAQEVEAEHCHDGKDDRHEKPRIVVKYL